VSATRLRGTRIWPAAFSNCLRHYQWRWTTPGGSTMARGPFSAMFIPRPMFPWFSSVSTRASRAAFHFEVGRRLAQVREEGVLIAGSGNLVHNLHAYAWGRHLPDPYDWAVRFEREARGLLISGETAPLIAYERLGREALLAVPTPDHYLPLLYAIGTRQNTDGVTFPVEGVDGGSISMLTVQVG